MSPCGPRRRPAGRAALAPFLLALAAPAAQLTLAGCGAPTGDAPPAFVGRPGPHVLVEFDGAPMPAQSADGNVVHAETLWFGPGDTYETAGSYSFRHTAGPQYRRSGPQPLERRGGTTLIGAYAIDASVAEVHYAGDTLVARTPDGPEHAFHDSARYVRRLAPE